jgi:hypothetical protein
MSKRKRVDWEKELQKTEEIRMKGFRTSIFGFVIAVLFIFGVSRINDSASIFPLVITIGCFLAATIILVLTLKRRSQKLQETRSEENKESE